jgi:iron complex transport system substrate-binding protein
MRICSLLPSTTEIVYALGLGDELVAVTHECDYPPEAASKPHITRSYVDGERMDSRAIDALVSARAHEHTGLYALDRDLLERLDPDLILTQELCDVCAVSYAEVQQAVRALYGERTVLSLEPQCLDEVLEAILRVGQVTGREARAATLVQELQQSIDATLAAVAGVAERPRVACLEWLDPPWAGGHWVPEMVRLAGGVDPLGEEGAPSRRVTWEEVLAAQPEVVVLMPCGFDVERTLRELARAVPPSGWGELPAVRHGRVFAVNANAYFSRPGPRLVEGLHILAGLLHPERVVLEPDEIAWRPYSQPSTHGTR